ncbi:outer membrane protein assembly factor BamE [Allopusillimonas ginsengisoli]|nr:outer membrane protein assembly factor BamE [Allopusillimonas ginsengisoli]
MLRTGLAAAVLATGLAACGSTNWGFPYRPNVQQGNWITSEQVAQLQPGMTREQVRYILGTPTLQDIFHSNRWDYPYYNNPGYGDDQQRKFTVWFDGDNLIRWEGDQQPDRQPFQKADTGMQEKAERDAAAGASGGQPAVSGGVPASGSYTLPDGSVHPQPGQTVPQVGTGEPGMHSTTPDANAQDAMQPTDGSTRPADEAQRIEPRQPLINRIEPRPATGAPSPGRGTSEPLR